MERFVYYWQHLPEFLDPVLIRIGPVQIYYYGLMYVAAFVTVYLLMVLRTKTESFSITKLQIENYLIWAAVGVLAGGRLGYVFFYDPIYYWHHPWEIFLPFRFGQGIQFTGIAGMSYHGGLLGVSLATWLFCRRMRMGFWCFVDFVIPAVPLGYTFGRLGNFINGELYGRVTNVPWGMYFPKAPGNELRHPSQLYEAFFEGVFLFLLLWFFRRKTPFHGFLFCLYLLGYAGVRFMIEFVRQPDEHLGLIAGLFSMGQVLCLFMAGAGLLLLFFLWRHSHSSGRKLAA